MPGHTVTRSNTNETFDLIRRAGDAAGIPFFTCGDSRMRQPLLRQNLFEFDFLYATMYRYKFQKKKGFFT